MASRFVVISSGFMDVGPNNIITVLSDTATLESDITIARAEEAKQKQKKIWNRRPTDDLLLWQKLRCAKRLLS